MALEDRQQRQDNDIVGLRNDTATSQKDIAVIRTHQEEQDSTARLLRQDVDGSKKEIGSLQAHQTQQDVAVVERITHKQNSADRAGTIIVQWR